MPQVSYNTVGFFTKKIDYLWNVLRSAVQVTQWKCWVFIDFNPGLFVEDNYYNLFRMY